MSDAVTEYGRLIGLDDLALGSGGAACSLQWGDGSTLEIEEVGDHLLVSLSFPAPHPSSRELVHALSMVDLRPQGVAVPLQVGRVGQGQDAHLVVLARLLARGAGGQQIQAAVEDCRKWQRRWETECKRGGV
jgi:type III secretion system chaperone SycN